MERNKRSNEDVLLWVLGSNNVMEQLIEQTVNQEVDMAAQLPSCDKVDALGVIMQQFPKVDAPLVHLFTPGLYCRQITMPTDSLVISKVHTTEHPFLISKGVVSVWIDGEGVKKFTAPYLGVTKAGTRRVLYIHEECVWTTFHVTDNTVVEEIEKEITCPHEISDEFKKAVLERGGTPIDILKSFEKLDLPQ